MELNAIRAFVLTQISVDLATGVAAVAGAKPPRTLKKTQVIFASDCYSVPTLTHSSIVPIRESPPHMSGT